MKIYKFNESTSDDIASDLNKEMLLALSRFGTYSFDDKGQLKNKLDN